MGRFLSAVFLMGAMASALTGCQEDLKPAEGAFVLPAQEQILPDGEVDLRPLTPEVPEGKELLALADSEEDAKKIAELYGIELTGFSYGVATFHTTENLQDVIRRGRENGWPALDLNAIQHLN